MLAAARFQVALQGAADTPSAWQAVVAAFEDLLAQGPDDPNRLRNLALAEKYLGSWYDSHRPRPDALPHYRRAMELDARRVSLGPEDRQARMDLAIDQSNVAGILQITDVPGSIAMYEQSVATRRHLAETDPRDVFAAGRLGAALWRLGHVYSVAGRPQDAMVVSEEATRVLNRALVERHDVPIMVDLAVSEYHLGEIYETLHRSTAACAAWRRVEQRLPQIASAAPISDLLALRRNLPARLAACAQTSR